MYSLSCKDLGEANCDFTATGETKEDVMMQAKDHAMSVHGKTEAELTSPEMMDAAMAAVKEM